MLLVFGIFQTALPLEDRHLQSSEEQRLAYYIRDIVHQQFESGRSILVSWPSDASKEIHT